MLKIFYQLYAGIENIPLKYWNEEAIKFRTVSLMVVTVSLKYCTRNFTPVHMDGRWSQYTEFLHYSHNKLYYIFVCVCVCVYTCPC